MRKIIPLALLISLLAVPTAFAQPGVCGFQYEVIAGDSVFGIAEKCDVAVEDIREFNSGIGSLIQPGDILFLPDPAFEPVIGVELTATTVAIDAAGFPPLTRLFIGVGLPGETALADVVVTTSSTGTASATLALPANPPAETELFVTVATADNSLQVTSPAFTPEDAAAGTIITENTATDSPAVALVAPDYARLAPPPAPVDVTAAGVIFDEIIIYMVAPPTSEAVGIAVGCTDNSDTLVPVQVTIDRTVAPLTASIDALLERTPAELDLPTFSNPLAAQALEIDQIAIVNGTAQIALSGEVTPVDPCAAATLTAALEATALQYATVDAISVTVDGVPWAEALAG